MICLKFLKFCSFILACHSHTIAEIRLELTVRIERVLVRLVLGLVLRVE